MCGIVGYYGFRQAIPILLAGLKRLEYRGYDSAGISLLVNDEAVVFRAVGKVADLESSIKEELSSTVGLGHTRWATHGAPSAQNAHPHQSRNKQFFVVHNGIIENHAVLRKELEKNGFVFESETDTEVVAHLIEYFYEDDFIEAVKKMLSKIEGAYALLILDTRSKTLVAAKIGSPLMIGVGEKEYFVGSDASPFIEYTQQTIILKDEQLAIINEEGLSLQDYKGFDVRIELEEIPYGLEAIQKSGYEHYMLKEIYEQPTAIRNCYAGKLQNIDGVMIEHKRYDRITFLGCGTSYYAGLVARQLLEKNNQVTSVAELSSEFRYRQPVLRAGDLVVALSQSGETADTLEAIKLAKKAGTSVCGLINTPGSSIARECAQGMYLHAGPEISVASTKAFTTQITASILLSLYLSDNKEYRTRLVQDLKIIPEQIEEFLEEQRVQTIAEQLVDAKHFIFIGRKQLYPVALEGALKLQEISYVPAQGFPAGELKHGPLALLEEGMPVVCLLRKDDLAEKMLSNIEEAKSRSATIILVTDYEDDTTKRLADYVIRVPRSCEETSPIHYVIALQLFAYYVAYAKGLPIDQPRNLAKAVTVE